VMKPTIFCGVPRVYDRIYTGLLQTMNNYVLNSGNLFLHSRKFIICESFELKVSIRKFSLEA
jgi:long-subunit acyl-CoA synthetase (AMP-forming)